MRRIFFLASIFVFLTWTPTPCLLGQPPASAEKAAVRQPSLIELGKLYQALDLPLPPKGAFFAVTGDFNVPLSYMLSNEELHYQIHFATGGPYPRSHYQVWQGFREYPGRKLEVVFARPPRLEVVLRYLKLNALRGPSFGGAEGNGDLIFAIQCQLLQHFEMPKFFYSRCEKRLKEPFQRNLVLLAGNYWVEELANPKRDRTEVVHKLRMLVIKQGFFEALGSMEANDDERSRENIRRHQELLDRLDLTLKPIRTVPGSIEAMIEELLDDPRSQTPEYSLLGADGTQEDENSEQREGKWPAREPRPDPYRKLSNMGFAAIPLLIEHVDDQRLVREPLFPSALVSSDTAGEPSGVRTFESMHFPPVGRKVRYILSPFFDLDQKKRQKLTM